LKFTVEPNYVQSEQPIQPLYFNTIVISFGLLDTDSAVETNEDIFETENNTGAAWKQWLKEHNTDLYW
jgi:hypothetical protein